MPFFVRINLSPYEKNMIVVLASLLISFHKTLFYCILKYYLKKILCEYNRTTNLLISNSIAVDLLYKNTYLLDTFWIGFSFYDTTSYKLSICLQVCYIVFIFLQKSYLRQAFSNNFLSDVYEQKDLSDFSSLLFIYLFIIK